MLYCRTIDDNQYLTPDDILVQRSEEEKIVEVSDNGTSEAYSVEILAQAHSVQYTSVTVKL
jgi:hypothetical protein